MNCASVALSDGNHSYRKKKTIFIREMSKRRLSISSSTPFLSIAAEVQQSCIIKPLKCFSLLYKNYDPIIDGNHKFFYCRKNVIFTSKSIGYQLPFELSIYIIF